MATLREWPRYANGHATRMATLREWPRYANGHATRMATLCERRWELTHIKRMLTYCLDAKREWGKQRQSASGGNPRRSALHRLFKSCSV
ncbi:MAG: hypothetical protein F6K55_01110 [Moorea sp. SIO4A3]|nr:hypothetical protein [Moorena sp. SIO4A3]